MFTPHLHFHATHLGPYGCLQLPFVPFPSGFVPFWSVSYFPTTARSVSFRVVAFWSVSFCFGPFRCLQQPPDNSTSSNKTSSGEEPDTLVIWAVVFLQIVLHDHPTAHVLDRIQLLMRKLFHHKHFLRGSLPSSDTLTNSWYHVRLVQFHRLIHQHPAISNTTYIDQNGPFCPPETCQQHPQHGQ